MPLMRLFPHQKNQKKKKYRHKGRQKVSRDTVNGNIRFERIRWWSPEHGTDDTIDRLIGAVADTISVGIAREQSQIMAMVALEQSNAWNTYWNSPKKAA